MAGHRARWTTGATLPLAVAVTLGTTGCSGGGTPSGSASQAASAVSSLASQADSMLSSATAEAGRRLGEVKNGIDARSAVTLGTPATASDGHATVAVRVENRAGSAKSFAVRVDFKDSGGNLLDTVLVTVPGVPAGKTATATARSIRELSGPVRAEVGTALRY
ncbi:hypothetical protein ACFC08_20900 [Streptomyces sp. NPDC056112]|uniref:hypothetical protein n=1 Tax=Streptomyces sp. NPDC056112 TaxID=3345715 RepID=UPI0035DE06F9